MEAIAEVEAKFILKSWMIKPINSILTLIDNNPLADDRDEDGWHDSTQPSQHEEHVSQEEDDFSSNVERFPSFVILIVHIEHAGPEKGDKDRTNEKKSITFQDQKSDPIEVGVGLTTGSFEDIGIECGKTTKNEGLRDCL